MSRRQRWIVPITISSIVLAVILIGFVMLRHAQGEISTVALDDQPKGVTVVKASAAMYQQQRRYVGTLEPWLEARVGPQIVSAYVSSVLVRPGDVVRRGDIVATLDCRDASSASHAVAEQARALESRQKAAAAEAERLSGLLQGGFVSANEVEQRVAESNAAAAQLSALRSQATSKELGVNDCILRAPFAGEIAMRSADPGTFARPGSTIVTVVDRSTVRVVARVPEQDVRFVKVGVTAEIHALATDTRLEAKISRCAPQADAATRTMLVEIDIADTERKLPVGTTAEVSIDIGERDATEVPLTAARIRGDTASIVTIVKDVAKKIDVKVMGEQRGKLFVDTLLIPGTPVVVEGRAQLRDGDHVAAKDRS